MYYILYIFHKNQNISSQNPLFKLSITGRLHPGHLVLRGLVLHHVARLGLRHRGQHLSVGKLQGRAHGLGARTYRGTVEVGVGVGLEHVGTRYVDPKKIWKVGRKNGNASHLVENLKDCVVFGTSGPSDPVIAPPFEVLGLIMLGRSLVR